MWYFAYGSNLSSAQMTTRTGLEWESQVPRQAYLPGYRLEFNMNGGDGLAFANIVRPGDGVWGVLYWCDDQALHALDGYEEGYERVRLEVLDLAGTHLEVVAYVARLGRTTDTGQPTVEYVRRILSGARGHGLPEQYVRTIVDAAGRQNCIAHTDRE